jgi:hypothetical protein
MSRFYKAGREELLPAHLMREGAKAFLECLVWEEDEDKYFIILAELPCFIHLLA